MRCSRPILPLSLVLAAAACHTSLNPGRCNTTGDCQSMAAYASDICDLDPDIQGDGRCVPPCNSSADCQGGRVCSFNAQGIGRCLFPTDGAGGTAGTGGGGNSGGAGATGGGAGSIGTVDGGMDANSCGSCATSTPVCFQGGCVQCATSADCATPSKPICDPTTHSCRACSSDDECVAKLGNDGYPGVCLSNLDGHCAVDAETVYVQMSSTCTMTAGLGGTTAIPYCTLDLAASSITDSRALVVIRGTVSANSWTYQRGAGHPVTSFIGQQSAVVASGATPGFNMSSGIAYIRDVKFSPSAAVCISATGGTLELEHLVVDSCQGGGIYLGGAAFDIENTTVTNNGPGTIGATTWGGILVNALPTAGTAILNLDTVDQNKGPGVACSAAITGTGVYASANSSSDVGSTCGFSSCSPMSATCGAQ